jgi:hypothetical protein
MVPALIASDASERGKTEKSRCQIGSGIEACQGAAHSKR